MKNSKNKLLILALGGVIFTPFANAEMISTDLNELDDGLATLDTTTGLEWLDLSETTGMSFNQVVSLLDTTYAGWRLPTFDEVKGLMNQFFPDANYGTAGYTGGFSKEDRQIWEDYLGSTNSDINAGWHVKEDGSTSLVGMAGARRPESQYSWIYLDRSRYSMDTASQSYGVYLVSDGGTTMTSINNPDINIIGFEGDVNASPVPISLSSSLLALGLLGLRRKKT